MLKLCTSPSHGNGYGNVHQTRYASDSSSLAEVEAMLAHRVRDPWLWHGPAKTKWGKLLMQTPNMPQWRQTTYCLRASA